MKYKDTGYYSSTLLNYLSEKEHLKTLYNNFPSLNSFEELAINKSNFSKDKRIVLSNTLKEQYSNILTSEKVLNNIESLKNDNTFTICTGHQLNLAGGPLYFIYKIATIIKLSRQLKENKNLNVVPIFWMATEDHDFKEINHFNIFGKTPTWETENLSACGRIETNNIDTVISEICEILGSSAPFAEQAKQIIREAYLENKTLANASRFLINALFKDFGLVVIDADNKDLKQLFSEIIIKDITQQNSFKHISQTCDYLKDHKETIQVNPREINFFYLTDNFRERIVNKENGYHVLNTDIYFSEQELIDKIKSNPENFSPNALLRPLYQETILPNLAYIGGGAEIIYWLELKSTFNFYNTTFPLLILRNSALIIDKNSEKKIHNLGFTESDFFKSTYDLSNIFIEKNATEDISFEQEIIDFKNTFEKLNQKAKQIDNSLLPNIEAEKTKLLGYLSHLENKLLKAEKKKHEQQIQQIIKLKEKLFPKTSLQERHDNFLSFYINEGPAWIEDIINLFEPLNFEFDIIKSK